MVKQINDLKVFKNAGVIDGQVHLTTGNYGDMENPVCSYNEAIAVIERLERELSRFGIVGEMNVIAGRSWDGFNIIGDPTSIREVARLEHHVQNTAAREQNLFDSCMKYQEEIKRLKSSNRYAELERLALIKNRELKKENELLKRKLETAYKSAGTYCWERYKGREPMFLNDPAVFTSHEWQKITEYMEVEVENVSM